MFYSDSKLLGFVSLWKDNWTKVQATVRPGGEPALLRFAFSDCDHKGNNTSCTVRSLHSQKDTNVFLLIRCQVIEERMREGSHPVPEEAQRRAHWIHAYRAWEPQLEPGWGNG